MVQYQLFVALADSRGLIGVPSDDGWNRRDTEPRDNYLISPYTFAKNFQVIKSIQKEEFEGWMFDQHMTDDVFRHSYKEASTPSKIFELRKTLGMEMEDPRDERFNRRINCYRRINEPGTEHNYIERLVNLPREEEPGFNEFGYIFFVEPHIITDMRGMSIEHETYTTPIELLLDS